MSWLKHFQMTSVLTTLRPWHWMTLMVTCCFTNSSCFSIFKEGISFHFLFRRSISDISINSNTAISNDPDLDTSTRDFDNELDAMGKKFERIELSVGETTQSYFPGMNERNSKVWGVSSSGWLFWKKNEKVYHGSLPGLNKQVLFVRMAKNQWICLYSKSWITGNNPVLCEKLHFKYTSMA